MVQIVDKRLNVYTCKKCGNKMVTCHACEGVTPAMIGCDKCKDGEAWSSFYEVPSNLTPKYEWYKPESDDEIIKQLRWELLVFNKDTFADLEKIGISFESIVAENKLHIKKGGLLLRSVKMPPTLLEFISYIKENNLSISNPESLYAGYSDGGWIDTAGRPVKNWKLKLRTLHSYAKPKQDNFWRNREKEKE